MESKGHPIAQAKASLRRYCAYQDRCHKEVREKLQEMGIIPQAIDLIITELIADNFLNEERFAKSFARGKFRIKKWGKQRIVRELKFRNISRFNIKIALKEIEDKDYSKTLDELALKRLREIKETHPLKRKKKLADYLLYRGWERHLVYEKINELIS